MNFTAPSALLARAAELAKKTSTKHAPFDRLHLSGGPQLVITSSTGTLALRQVIDVPANGADLMVPADAFARDTAKLSGEITAKIDPAKACMVLAAKPRRFVLPMTYDCDNPPRLLHAEGESREVYAGALRTALERAKHAVCLDATHEHLHGVLVELTGDAMRSVASNGHYMTVHGKRDGAPDASVFFPLACIALLLELLPETGTVRVNAAGPLTIEGAGWTLAQNKVAGAFPAWSHIAPAVPPPVRITTDARALAAEIGATFSLAAEHTVRFGLEAGTLRIRGEASGREASTELAVGAEPRDARAHVWINGEYMLAVLGSLPAGECTMAIDGPLDPVTIEPADRSSLSVMMPMRGES